MYKIDNIVYQDNPTGHEWTTLHYLEMSIGHPFDGPGSYLMLFVICPVMQ